MGKGGKCRDHCNNVNNKIFKNASEKKFDISSIPKFLHVVQCFIYTFDIYQ